MADFAAIQRALKQLQVKPPELKEPLVPIREWIKDPYYIGKGGVFDWDTKIGLYPYYQDLLCDIFEYEGKYDIVVLGGGIGCTSVHCSYYQSNMGLCSLQELASLIKKHKIRVLTDGGIKPVTAVHLIGKKPTKVITFRNGTRFEITHNHLFRTFDGDGNLTWSRADALSVGDIVLCSKHHAVYPLCESDYEELAYTLGYFIGDGDVDKYHDSVRVVFGDHKYESVAYRTVFNDFARLSKTNHVCIYETHNKCNGKVSEHTSRRFTIYPKQDIVDLFKSCGGCAGDKHIPDIARKFSKHGICELLAGLFDSDGCIEKSKRTQGGFKFQISYTSRNEELVMQIAQHLHNLGVTCSVKTVDRSHSGRGVDYRLRIGDTDSLKRFNELIHLRVEYKKQVLDEACLQTTEHTVRFKSLGNRLHQYALAKELVKDVGKIKKDGDATYGQIETLVTLSRERGYNDIPELFAYIVDNHCYPVEVASVEDSEDECGDIEVDGIHTYVRDGFIQHNTGKSTFGYYCMVRKLYEFSVYTNVQSRFGLLPQSPIGFLYFCAVSKFMAVRLGKQLRETFDNIPYFNERFPRDKGVDSELRFPQNLAFYFGTGEGDMIGLSLAASILDEANFKGDARGDNTDLSAIQKLHSSILTRQESRFGLNGKNYGMNVIISSATTSNSYTEKLFKDAETNPRIKAVNLRTWDVKPWKHKKERFYVFCGNEKYDPFVMDSHEKIESMLNLKTDHSKTVKDVIRDLPQELRRLVDAVPVDLQPHYQRDIYQSLRDFSGVSVYAQGKLFQDKHVFDQCIDTSLPNIFSRNEFVIETNNDSPTNCIQYYLERGFADPQKPRFIHIDLGLTNDATGIACCYKSGETVADGVRTPVYTYDFSLRIVPPPMPRKISIARVNEFILYLSRRLRIGMVSMDQFQCLHGDTKIYTDHGCKSLRDVQVGDFVRNDSGYCRVLEKFCYENAPVLRVVSHRGKELIGTPNHKIRVRIGTKRGKPWEGHAWSPQKFKRPEVPVWGFKELKDLKAGDVIDTDYIVYDTGMHLFDDPVKEREMAYLVGYYLGNGHKYIHGAYDCSMTTGTREYAEKLKGLLDCYNTGYSHGIYEKKHPTRGFSVSVTNKEFYNFLTALGFEDVCASDKVIPDKVKGLSNNFLLGMFSGYFDADGTKVKTYRDGKLVSTQLTCSSISEKLLKDWKEILEYRLGVRGYLSQVRKAGKLEVLGRACNAKDCFHLGITGNVESLDIGVSEKLRGVRNYRAYMDKVLSVERAGNADVYDIHVDKEAAYVANGVYSHNSQGSLQFFEENRIPCRYQSVDRTDKAYLFFVECMYRQIVKFPADFAEAIKHELFNLDWNRDRHKVDHPSDTAHGGMKDRMDAVVGALYNAYEVQMPSYNPQDILSLTEHNPVANIQYREGCLGTSSMNGNQQMHSMIGIPDETVMSGYDESEILRMPLCPDSTEEDIGGVYGSSIDWDSVLDKRERDE